MPAASSPSSPIQSVPWVNPPGLEADHSILLVLQLKCVEICFHYSICLHVLVLNKGECQLNHYLYKYQIVIG